MYKKVLPVVLAMALLLSACGKKEDPTTEVPPVESSTSDDAETMDPPTSTEDVIPDTQEDTDDEEFDVANATKAELVEHMMETATENLYPDLKVEAVILERKALLAGHSFNVNVTITNNGEKGISFAHGSGNASNPDSLHVYSEDLQTLIPESDLGPMTMDMQMDTLLPGETKSFTYTIMGVEPLKNFDQLTYDYLQKNDAYIGHSTAEELGKEFPEIKAVAPGKYQVKAVLFYQVMEDVAEGEEPTVNMTSEPTGYTVGTMDITLG